MKITVKKSSSAPECKIHHYYTKGKGNALQFSPSTPDSIKKDLQSQFKNKTLKGALGESVFYRNNSDQGHDLCMGLGDASKLTLESFRVLASHIHKNATNEKVNDLDLLLDALPTKLNIGEVVQALTEGFTLSDYSFDTFKEKKTEHKMSVNMALKKANATLSKSLQQGLVLGETTNFARWLGDCPGNFMTPTQLANEAQKAAKGTALKVTAWNKARIKKERMESLIGVSNGSAQEPRFIIMEYKGAAASKKPICFVGKGLTFDCGGISIKASAGMEEMKYDMCGGAAVIGTMLAIAKLKLKVNAVAYVPASENMPGAAANKPGDIRPARNGKTIEINNTDAEGRLILADALSYAVEKKPAWIVDAATLTGAVMVALGKYHTGFFTRNDGMRDKMLKASKQTGEQMWQLPLTDNHSNDMKGYFADVTNLGPGRLAGSATAAAFLEFFTDENIPWVHVDVAGTAWHVSHLPYYKKKGATGVMVRTFTEMAKNHK